MSTSKQKIMLANLQENASCITSKEREKIIRKTQQPRRLLRKSQSIGQIALVIMKMNSDKSLPKAMMKLLSYSCEVAARSEVFNMQA